MALDQRVDLAAGNADADRLVPFGGAGEIGRGEPLDIIADTTRQVVRTGGDEAGAAVSAPQKPNAMVNGSPRAIGRSSGLPSPSAARGPADSMGWQESGKPFGRMSVAASASRMPGLRPKRPA